MLHPGERLAPPLISRTSPPNEDASMSCKRLPWAVLAVVALLSGESARADHPWDAHFHSSYIPWVAWYAPNSPYPYYFGPPYPETDYRTVQWVGTPVETAIAVKNQLVMMGIYPTEPLPPPKPSEKVPPPKPVDKGPAGPEGAPPRPEGNGAKPAPKGGVEEFPSFLPKGLR
jgi:hypothetical protein